MVATDLDGTFLGLDGKPSAENIEVARAAADRGIILVFATGRPARWLQVLDPLKPSHPRAITSNGAVIFDVQTDEVLHAHLVPHDDTIAFAHELEKVLPGVSFAVEYTHGWGRMEGYPVRGDFVEADVHADSVEELLSARDTVKLLAIHPHVHTHDMAEAAFPLSNGRLAGTFSMVRDDGLLEFCALGVSKASALQELLDDEHIHSDELAAFGDMPNDLEMLELAGHPFVMANGHELLLERGFRQAGHHDESGFGRALQQLLRELT